VIIRTIALKFAVLTDFGSTYTKMVCVDIKARAVVAATRVPSTVGSDAAIGLNQCFEAARRVLGNARFESALKLAASSAAGGLRMAVVGLTKSVSIKAGRNASFCAGAKIVYSTAGLLSEEDLEPLENSGAELLLLCGGYEGGNTEGLIHNAEFLSRSNLAIPVIYAGNSVVARNMRGIFKRRKKECFLTENTIPFLGALNIEPTTSVIRELFMSRITNMKGVGLVQKLMDGPIAPTPAAVLSAGELLCRGTGNEPGLGSMMMADIGGATTDIYSYAENKNFSGAKMIGTPDPFAKRTVEGDMGMRESSVCLVREVGQKKFAAQCGVSEAFLEKAIEKRTARTEYLDDDDTEKKVDYHIASAAVHIAARRHAGVVGKEYNSGCHLIQRGKNLTELRLIVGTGGVIVNGDKATGILKNAVAAESESGRVLLPENLDVLVDRDYVLFAAGLLREHDEAASLAVAKKSLGLT
jgi:uncharacterized protein (TIGR01319 family)